jgi:hypothetical protein
VQERPVGVEADTVKLTVPLNPPDDETVIVEVPLAWASIVEGVTGPAEIEKSGGTATLYVIADVVWETVPLAPVTVTVNVPAVIEWQERVAVRVVGTVMEATASQSRSRLGEAVKVTVPVKPFRGAIVIVVVQLFATAQGTVVGVADKSKSGAGTVTVIVAFCDNDPSIPVTFARYVPGATLLATVMLS